MRKVALAGFDSVGICGCFQAAHGDKAGVAKDQLAESEADKFSIALELVRWYLVTVGQYALDGRHRITDS